MKQEIHIVEVSPGSFQMQCNITDKAAIIGILLDISKAVAAQMKKEESPIAKPQLVLQ